MKKIVFLILSLVLISSTVFAADFLDLASNHWAYKNVMTLVEQKVINGYPDGTFKPGGQVTRVEFLKLIGVAAEGDEYFNNYKSIYKNWYSPYLSWATSHGYIMDGVELKNANEPVTRGEMAVIIAKIVLDKEITGTYTEDVNENGMENVEYVIFNDTNELSEENQLYIRIIANMGLINGYEDGTFRAGNYMSRAEVATIIYRFLSLK